MYSKSLGKVALWMLVLVSILTLLSVACVEEGDVQREWEDVTVTFPNELKDQVEEGYHAVVDDTTDLLTPNWAKKK